MFKNSNVYLNDMCAWAPVGLADVQKLKFLVFFLTLLGIFPVRISLFLEQCSRAPTDIDTLIAVVHRDQ